MKIDINKKVYFFSQSLNARFKDKTKFKNFVNYLLKNEGKNIALITFIFCSDEELRKLNNDFLNHNYYTDILTFDLSDSKFEITADIFISIDRVKENSKLINISFSKELHRVMIHGLLHLCGYKDKKKYDIEKIRATENKYLSKYFK